RSIKNDERIEGLERLRNKCDLKNENKMLRFIGYECDPRKSGTAHNTVFTHRAIRPSVRQGDFGEVAAAGQPCTG
ncbi:hypothetical protein, partial [Paenibacillus cellulosilyticus]|uniref:hypothetical protein n=1 Tax=Paenibacillus cellulosilyticus TaxID=375489 RepID=UPI001C63BFA4